MLFVTLLWLRLHNQRWRLHWISIYELRFRNLRFCFRHVLFGVLIIYSCGAGIRRRQRFELLRSSDCLVLILILNDCFIALLRFGFLDLRHHGRVSVAVKNAFSIFIGFIFFLIEGRIRVQLCTTTFIISKRNVITRVIILEFVHHSRRLCMIARSSRWRLRLERLNCCRCLGWLSAHFWSIHQVWSYWKRRWQTFKLCRLRWTLKVGVQARHYRIFLLTKLNHESTGVRRSQFFRWTSSLLASDSCQRL